MTVSIFHIPVVLLVLVLLKRVATATEVWKNNILICAVKQNCHLSLTQKHRLPD